MRKKLYTLKKDLKRACIISTRKRTNLFIIGEQKCGTTSLFKLLSRNAQILPASIKECNYFNTNKLNADKGFRNYHREFKQLLYKKYLYQLDATPDYFSDEKTAGIIHDYNPCAKIIIMLRNPVARFISAYNFYFSNIVDDLEGAYRNYFQYSEKGKAKYAFLQENPALTIEQFLNFELNGKSPLLALQRGHYFEHIANWEKYFDKKNTCILYFENLISAKNSEAEILKLEEFLSLPLEKEFPKQNSSLKKIVVPEEVILKLEKYYSVELNHLNMLIPKKNILIRETYINEQG
ncbi:MAG: sulfotransferase domain-containing protein [Chitinophagaceae bacterium]